MEAVKKFVEGIVALHQTKLVINQLRNVLLNAMMMRLFVALATVVIPPKPVFLQAILMAQPPPNVMQIVMMEQPHVA